MRQNLAIVTLTLILFTLLIPMTSANASPRNTELVIENIQIDPKYPQIGDLVSISADVYNSGLFETDSVASIVTAAYFVDDKLLYFDEIGNVKPGLTNKIKISSIPIWDFEPGVHKIKIILDYHNTITDENDSPEDNTVEKIFSFNDLKELILTLDSSPQYLVSSQEVLLQINISVNDSKSNNPLNNKKILVYFDDDEIPLTTNQSGFISFSKMITQSESLDIKAIFSGDEEYLPSSSSLTLYSIPNENNSGLIMQIVDKEKQYTFEDHFFEFVIFQDSYDDLFTKIYSHNAFIDKNTFWLPLNAGHEYFSEIYLEGRFIHLTENFALTEKNPIILKQIIIPDSAEIRFRVVDELGEPQSNVVINNWIYSGTTDISGFTDWIEVLPTINDVPYDVEIISPDKRISKTQELLVFSGEKKTITVILDESLLTAKIPDWLRNNAGWWANKQIDDSSFIEGLQYLIKNNIIKIPQTVQDSNHDLVIIPDWLRNNAGWWANKQIDDSSFIEGLQYLIKVGILKIH